MKIILFPLVCTNRNDLDSTDLLWCRSPSKFRVRGRPAICICVDLIAIVIQKSWLVGMIGNEQGKLLSMYHSWINGSCWFEQLEKSLLIWNWKSSCREALRLNRALSAFTEAFIFSFDFMNSEHNENGCYALNENSAARGNLRFGPWIHKEIFTWFLYTIRKSLHGQF